MGRTPFVMRADGSVSAMKATDLKEVAERDRRIRQLEDLNTKLAAEVDAQRPVVEMAQGWAHGGAWEWLSKLAEAVKVYESKGEK